MKATPWLSALGRGREHLVRPHEVERGDLRIDDEHEAAGHAPILGQSPPAELGNASCRDILDWAVTSFDPDTNTYKDKDPEEMVKYLDKLGVISLQEMHQQLLA